MDENKNLDKIDELLDGTSEENRVRFNLSDIQATESEADIPAQFSAPEEVDAVSSEPEMPVAPAASVEPTVQFVPTAPVAPEAVQAPVMNNAGAAPQFAPNAAPAPAAKAKKAKKEKKPKDKGKAVKALQGIVIALVAVVTLWTVMYTVDHTLAAQGYSPAFSVDHTEYDDGSYSYKCLGYKVQFMYDSNNNLTQKCVFFWEDGPNDIRYNNGELFEVMQ